MSAVALNVLAYGSGAFMALIVVGVVAAGWLGWWLKPQRYQNTTEIAEAELAAKEAGDADH